MSKESEDKGQDFQKHVTKRKKHIVFVKVSLPFNIYLKSVGPSLPSAWSSKWEKQAPTWMLALRDLSKMAMEIPFLLKLVILTAPLLSPVHISMLGMSSGGCLFMLDPFPSSYTSAVPHILVLRCWRTPEKNQKWLPFFLSNFSTSYCHKSL